MKKIIFSLSVIWLLSLLSVHPCMAANAENDYAVLKSGFAIGTTQRHEWYPFLQYNSRDDEFLVVWNNSGKLRNTCLPGDTYECTNSFHSLHARRISPDGSLIGDTITLIPPKGPREGVSWMSMPRVAYNPIKNQYMIAFTVGTQPPSTQFNETFILLLDSEGSILYGPSSLSSTAWNANHPDIVFNTAEQRYLVIFNDKYIFPERTEIDNVGFFLSDNGSILSGPFRIGTGDGAHFAPSIDYNPTDNTYILAWEDFRHAKGAWYNGPNDIYGAVLDSTGALLADIPVVEDCGSADEGSSQVIPSVAYNSDDNEFIVAWSDTRPSLQGMGVMGRLFHADGTAKGADFIISDTAGSQGAPYVVYVPEEKKYFAVWFDLRSLLSLDIYGKWLNPDGTAAGSDTLMYRGMGSQMLPAAAYSPASECFLIVWRDFFAPFDYHPVGPGANMAPEMKSDVRGTIYGKGE